MKNYISIWIIIALTNCKQGNNDVENRINGKWTHQSLVTPKKQLKKLRGLDEYFFGHDGSYKYTSVGWDVMTVVNGHYTIVDRSETKSKPLLILFPPITYNQLGDTIRQITVYEIVSLTKKKLTLRHPSVPLSDTLPLRWYNRLDNYKKE